MKSHPGATPGKVQVIPEISSELQTVLSSLALDKVRRHFIFCAGPKCCSTEEGEAVWKHVKARMVEQKVKESGVFRTKAACLRVCREGPIALVYPEGVWYRLASKEACDRIIDEHLIGGRPVTEFIISVSPLPGK